MNELFENIEEVKDFISIRGDYDFDEIRPYIRKACRKYIKPFCGEIYKELVDEQSGENAEIKNDIRSLLMESVINFAFYLNIPIGSVHYTSDGISVSDSENYKAANNAQVNDLRRDFLRSGHEALDELIILLNDNPELFEEYNTKYLEKNKSVLVQSADEFNEVYYIGRSRQTYLALLPIIKRVEDQYINTFLCADFLTRIKTTDVTDNNLKVKENLRKAVVAFTVSKTVYEGQFILDGNGIHLKFDVLPHEKTVTNINLKINDFLVHTKKEQEVAGLEYLKNAQRIIEDNPNDFPDCAGAVIINQSEVNETGSSFKPYDTKGVLGI